MAWSSLTTFWEEIIQVTAGCTLQDTWSQLPGLAQTGENHLIRGEQIYVPRDRTVDPTSDFNINNLVDELKVFGSFIDVSNAALTSAPLNASVETFQVADRWGGGQCDLGCQSTPRRTLASSPT